MAASLTAPASSPTEAQLDHQQRFRQVVLYGQLVMADPQKKAAYEKAAKATGKPLFSLTIADFFNALAVDEVDLSTYSGAPGNAIVVQAHDDFEVASVHVSISGTNGQTIENGEAVETPANPLQVSSQSGRWVYMATTAVPTGTNVCIAVAVGELPGSVSEATAGKSLQAVRIIRMQPRSNNQRAGLHDLQANTIDRQTRENVEKLSLFRFRISDGFLSFMHVIFQQVGLQPATLHGA